MLTKILDFSLNGMFLGVHLILKLRNRISTKTEERLMSDCAAAARRKAGLQTELDHPTVIRLYKEQVELVQEIKAASDRSVSLTIELRAHRKAMKKLAKVA